MSGVVTRTVNVAAVEILVAEGIPPFMARIYAARGISHSEQLAPDLSRLIPLNRLRNVDTMAALLADAITEGKKLLIVADYDADGATACAVGLRALRQFGANVDYLVPNRFEYGYGLTPEIVQLAAAQKNPDVLITVDNGIASIDGVAEANRLGMKVLVTDHHLPGDRLPDAWCIINPNQPDCTFPSKNLAGVGVMFYLMLALRAEFRKRGAYAANTPPSPPAPRRRSHRSGSPAGRDPQAIPAGPGRSAFRQGSETARLATSPSHQWQSRELAAARCCPIPRSSRTRTHPAGQATVRGAPRRLEGTGPTRCRPRRRAAR